MSSELLTLLKHIQPEKEKPKVASSKPPPTSPEMLSLLNRMDTREWLRLVEDQLFEAILYLRSEAKFIEHLPHCHRCRIEIQLDVERYYGSRSKWYLSLENTEYLEEEYPDCPKVGSYRIDNYWAQVARFRKGITESDANTMEFIMDRAKWAYKIVGNQIKLSRQLLRMVRTWDFARHTIEEFNRIYEELRIYEIANPPCFLG